LKVLTFVINSIQTDDMEMQEFNVYLPLRLLIVRRKGIVRADRGPAQRKQRVRYSEWVY
jgi:hypothetical protein